MILTLQMFGMDGLNIFTSVLSYLAQDQTYSSIKLFLLF